MNIKSIVEDGIYKISLKSVYDHIYGKDFHDFKNAFNNIFQEIIIQQEGEDVAMELEDMMYGFSFEFRTDKNGQQYCFIKDYYVALPSLFYILFELLIFSRKENNPEQGIKIWNLIHYLTESEKYFKLPNEKLQFN